MLEFRVENLHQYNTVVKNVNALYLWDRVVLVGFLVAFFKSLSLLWEANKIIPLL